MPQVREHHAIRPAKWICQMPPRRLDNGPGQLEIADDAAIASGHSSQPPVTVAGI